MGGKAEKDILVVSTLTSSGEPGISRSIIPGSLEADTEYVLRFILNTATRRLHAYVNGELRIANQPFIATASEVSSIEFIYDYASQVGVMAKIDELFIGNYNESRNNLKLAITGAEKTLSEAVVGTATGNYPKDAVYNLTNAIAAAKTNFFNCDLDEAQINEAILSLNNSVTSFAEKVIIASRNVSIQISPNTQLYKNNKLWYGGNSTYNNYGQGIWNSATNEMHYNINDLSGYTGSKFYRFPGGTMANLYKWKNAIGPLHSRVPNLNSHGDAGPQTNEFGPDEFGKMLETTAISEGIIVVSFCWDQPQDAADYVEYMNCEVGENPNGGTDWAQVRANNGHPEPYNIKYWEIGNELYGNWELSFINYPNSGDATRGGDAIKSGDANLYVNGGYRTFTDQIAVKPTSWVPADCQVNGSANQSLYVKWAPVDLSSAFSIKVGTEQWTKVDNFNNSGSNDKHYTLNEQSGKIQFGDGTKGMAPSGNVNVFVTYKSGRQPGFIEYYEAMKAVDPDITIIACFEKEPFYRLMAEKNKPFDGVAKHYYPGNNPNPGDELLMEVALAYKYKNKVAEHITYLNRYNNTSLNDKKVQQWLTEFAMARGNLSFAKLHAFIDGLVNSNYKDDVAVMLQHSYFKNDNTPMVETRSGGYIKSKGYAYHIFNHLHQDDFIKTTYSGGKTNFSNESINDAIALSSISKNGRIITLSMASTRTDLPLIAQIDMDNFPFTNKPYRLYKWHSVSPGYLEDNTNDNPKQVYLTDPYELSPKAAFTDTIGLAQTVVYMWVQESAHYLSELNETANNNVIKDISHNGSKPMTINGINYKKGLGLGSSTEIKYQLNKKYEHFVAEFGIDDNYTSGKGAFEIYVDGISVYQSGELKANTPNLKLRIDVANADSLEIRTTANTSYLLAGNARLISTDDLNVKNKYTYTINDVKVYPNPFKSSFNISFNKPETGICKLIDLSGKLVMEQKFTMQQNLKITPDAEGKSQLYILLVKTKNGVYVKRISGN